jgi:subtilisin family serine protease
VAPGMKAVICASVACGIAALCAAATAGACRNDADAAQPVEYSVGYASPDAFRSAVAQEHATVVARMSALRIARLRTTAEAAARMARSPGIRFVECIVKRTNASEPALLPALGKTTAWEWQFAAAHEDAVPGWVLRAASSVTIAVVDTGADLTAPDIAAKDPTAYSPRTGTSDVRDNLGHGTFVASLAAGSVTNGDGIAGFGGDAKLLIVKAGAGDGSLADVDEAAAIAYAVDQGAQIINLSFGGTTTSAAERSAIDYATTHGVLVVVAAGNHYLAGNPVLYPAALVQPIGSNGIGGTGLSVGASTNTGARAAFSNTGTYLSLVAPGDGVFSAVSSTSPATSFPRVQLPGSTQGLYGYGSGTSFAAPEVAGAAALVMAANPVLSAQDVARVLKETASGGGAWTPELGFGVLDVAKAVQVATGALSETARAALKLAVSIVHRRVRLSASLSSLVPGVSTAARTVTFDRYNATRKRWQRLRTVRTRADGRAVLTLRGGAKTRLRFRVRWAGALDLGPASSNPVIAKARR